MKSPAWQILLVAIVGIASILAGCGSSGTRMLSNVDGDVVRGELVIENLNEPLPENEYIIGQGDEMDITFLYNSDLNLLGIKVRPDGRISLPVVGDIRAAGMTTTALDSIITARYATILREPQITVIMKRFTESFVYVLGEVDMAGAFELEPGLTLLGALAKSRGPNERGRKSSVLVIRRISDDRIVGMQFDLNDLLEKGRFDLDIPLRADDIVYVPTSRIKKAEDFANTMYAILGNPMTLYMRGWQVANAKIVFDFYRRTAQTY
jgi:polysaccharide export outer membrane protein